MSSVALAQKEQSVQELNQNFTGAQASFLVNYQGCTCADITGLRRKLKPIGADVAVIKNTLACRAISGTSMEKMQDMLAGPTAVIWAKKDIVTPAKVLKEFGKDRDYFKIKGGFVDGQVVDGSAVAALAELPSKEQLLSTLLALINAPATRLLQTINAPAQQLVSLLDAWRAKIEGK
ncbi:MAG: 50S ribosomal protein L10 [Deltaproteobacteria bacterium]|nr:50S ribosomal protein L10 [Deltaproteobacteria bacterium]